MYKRQCPLRQAPLHLLQKQFSLPAAGQVVHSHAPALHLFQRTQHGVCLLYTSRDAFEKLAGDNKDLFIIPGAVHTDLYDRLDVIPFDKMAAFFRQYMG